MGKLPGADRLYLEQMMFSAYCSALRGDPSISESAKARQILEYRRELNKSLATAVPLLKRDEFQGPEAKTGLDNCQLDDLPKITRGSVESVTANTFRRGMTAQSGGHSASFNEACFIFYN